MHRVSRNDLETMLSVALRAAPKHVKHRLRSKLATEADLASDALAAVLADRLDNRSYMVVAADMVKQQPCGERIGIFGVDEADPFEAAQSMINIGPLVIDGQVITALGGKKP
jgi:hypothetical protein